MCCHSRCSWPQISLHPNFLKTWRWSGFVTDCRGFCCWIVEYIHSAPHTMKLLIASFKDDVTKRRCAGWKLNSAFWQTSVPLKKDEVCWSCSSGGQLICYKGLAFCKISYFIATTKECGPIVGTSTSTDISGCCDRPRNRLDLIRLAFANHINCYFKFGLDMRKLWRVQSQNLLTL